MAIDVRIEPDVSGGLRVITHVPAERPCRLEGRNGIGKSVAIRLLCLASGAQPYADDPGAWRSLKHLVGSTKIQLTGLAGSHDRALVTLTPDLWPQEPMLEIADWLGELTLDGSPAPLSQLFTLLSVVHLSGTERLVDTLHRHEARFRTALQATKNSLLKSEDQRARLGELQEQLAFLTPASESRDAQNLRDLERRLTSSLGTLGGAKQRLIELQRAATLDSMLASSSGDRQSALEQARQRDAQAQAALAAASARLDAAIQALSKGNQRQKKRATAEDRLRRLTNELTGLREERSRTAAAMDLPELAAAQSDHLAPALVERLSHELAEAERLASALRRRQYESQLTSEQSDIRAELTVVLDGAIERGNGDFVAARIDSRDVSVAELRDGVTHTAATYQPLETGAALAAALEQHQGLTAIQRSDAKTRTVATQIVELQREISQLPGATDSDDLTAEVATAREAKEQAQAEAQIAATQVGQLSAGLLAGKAAADAAAQIRQTLDTHGVARTDLTAAVASTMTQVTRLEVEVALVEGEIAQLREAETRRKVRRREWASRLGASDDYQWLLAGLGWNPGNPEDTPWAALAERISLARTTANQLVRDVEGLSAAIGDTRPSEYSEASRHALEREGVKDFADEHVTEALFDNGTVESLDLRDQTVTWQTRAGERRTRPLSAFSSGEQALGFIRARLRQLTSADAENRLIFLDEFGAFVSADRRKPLAELLADDALNPLSAQIIVVLPLQVDYTSELPQTRGELRTRYAARVQDIEKQGYFAERFDP